MRIRILKTACTLLLALPLITAMPYEVKAQEYSNTPVTVSKEKVKIGGRICYSHIVLEKQTLYSISKAYGVSIEEIYRFNPTLKETGLKKNSIIIIPATEDKKVAEKKEEEKKDEIRTEASPRIHIRKWYEDIDMIAEQYGISAEALISANGLAGKKLQKRQKLVIPYPDEKIVRSPEATPKAEETTAQEVLTASADTVAREETVDMQDEWFYFPKDKVHTTVLLPMRTAEGRLSRNNMDFYSGIMLAVYDLAKEGVNTDINVYDITDQSTPVTKEDIEDSDLVIGPISTADLTRLLQTSPDVRPVVSPLDPRAERLTATYSNLIQAPTPHKAQYQDLVNWIKEDLKENDKVFMFSERITRNKETVASMKEVMDSSGIEYIPFSYSILEGRDVVEPLKEMMTAEGANRIYIASESEAFVNDVVRNLNLMLIENFEVVLYAPSKIRSFETIEVEHFHKTAMHVSTTYYINYEDQAVKDFLLKYRALYNTEPTQFAFQGYDIGRYFISLCHKYGDRWPERLSESERAMLQSTFRFMREDAGGFVNKGVRRILYESNWTITQVR